MLSKEEIRDINRDMLGLGRPDIRDNQGYNRADFTRMKNIALLRTDYTDEESYASVRVMEKYAKRQFPDKLESLTQTREHYESILSEKYGDNMQKAFETGLAVRSHSYKDYQKAVSSGKSTKEFVLPYEKVPLEFYGVNDENNTVYVGFKEPMKGTYFEGFDINSYKATFKLIKDEQGSGHRVISLDKHYISLFCRDAAFAGMYGYCISDELQKILDSGIVQETRYFEKSLREKVFDEDNGYAVYEFNTTNEKEIKPVANAAFEKNLDGSFRFAIKLSKLADLKTAFDDSVKISDKVLGDMSRQYDEKDIPIEAYTVIAEKVYGIEPKVQKIDYKSTSGKVYDNKYGVNFGSLKANRAVAQAMKEMNFGQTSKGTPAVDWIGGNEETMYFFIFGEDGYKHTADFFKFCGVDVSALEMPVVQQAQTAQLKPTGEVNKWGYEVYEINRCNGRLKQALWEEKGKALRYVDTSVQGKTLISTNDEMLPKLVSLCERLGIAVSQDLKDSVAIEKKEHIKQKGDREDV